MRQADEALAGLNCGFKSPELPSSGCAVRRPTEGKRQHQARGGGSTGNTGGGAPAASRGVNWNLKQRNPGPAYRSPEPPASTQQPQQPRPASSSRTGTSVGVGAPADVCGRQLPGGAGGLAHLKLASLARRRAATDAAQKLPRPGETAACQCAEADAEAASQPVLCIGADATAAEGAAAQPAEQQAALLRDVERLLAGCSSQVLEDPQLLVLPPTHVLLGLPVLPIPLPTAPTAATGGPAVAGAGAAPTTATAVQHPAPPAAAGRSPTPGPGDQIAAYRPAPSSSSSSTHEPLPAGSLPDGPGSSYAGSSCIIQGPATLQEALLCLGLLPPPTGGEPTAAGAASGSRSAAGPAAWAADAHLPWVRLRAVQVVLAAKQQAAAEGELLPLVRRLRQARMHLEFHKVNVQRGRSRSRSPGRNGGAGSGGLPSPAAPPGPWLSGRSSTLASKHQRNRSGSPAGQLVPRPKVACPTPEASELQVRLLASLQQKLLQKLGLALLRQAAAAGQLRQRLLGHVAAQAAADRCRDVLLAWHGAAVPTEQQVAAAFGLAGQLQRRRQQAQLVVWRQWAAHSAWQRQQLAEGQLALRQRLLAAAIQHWRCYCQQQLVRRLRAALAARWLVAWGRRRPFSAWRQAARRSAQLKEALLSRSIGGAAGGGQQQLPPLPSQLEVLAATAAAFQPVRDFVAEAVQQLKQLRQGLRFGAPGSSRVSAAAAAAAAEELEAFESQQHEEEMPLGSVEALLALLPPRRPQQPQQQQLMLLLANEAVAQLGGPAVQLPPIAVAPVGDATTCDSAASSAAPAPDPSSPCGYHPASYASPPRQTAQQQQWQGRPAGRMRTAQHPIPAAAAAAAEQQPAAVEVELLDCQEQVELLRQQLAALEQESEELQQQCSQLEEAAAAAQQHTCQQQHACTAAAAAKEAAAEAMRAAVQQHAAAAAECSQREWRVKQRQQECGDAGAAEAGARAAAHAATELLALAGMGVQRWSKAVEGIAKDLAACHRTQQAPVMVRLKESRQRLEQHQQEAAVAQQQLPGLQAAAKQAGQHAQQAQQAVLEAQQHLVAAAEQRARCQQQLEAAMRQHEAAAVAAVAAEQEASAGEQQQRLLASQQQLAMGRMRQAAAQVIHKQQQAVLLQQHVQQLQHRHREAVAAMQASGQQQQRRVKLKRRLQATHEAGAAAAAPGASQQRRPPPPPSAPAVGHSFQADSGMQAAAVGAAAMPFAPPPAGAVAFVTDAAAGALVLRVPPCDWSACSSEPGSPRPEEAPSQPLTVDEAAARFYCRTLLRHAMHGLRLEACTTRAALLAAADRWQRRQQAAVLLAWRRHAAEAADWLFAVGVSIRRRWLLRQWRAAVAERQWQREADAAADAFARWRLLATGVAAWRLGVRHERWRDAAHMAVVQTRMRHMVQSWLRWTRHRRQKAAKQRAAMAVYERRLLTAAVQQWRWVQHSKALLHRVFSTAVDLWQEEVGVRLHQRNYELAQACWGAWQLHVLQAQEQRRQAMLWNAAAAFRERQLRLAGLQAFRQGVADAHEDRRLALLQAHMFFEWRRLAATSDRHWQCHKARQHRQRQLLHTALYAWRSASEATACQLAHFWLRWQVQTPLRRVLLAWRACAACLRHEARLQGLAQSFRRQQLLRRCVMMWRQLADVQHEERVLLSMAEVHRERRLQQLGLAAFAVTSEAAGQPPSSGTRRSDGLAGSSQTHAGGRQAAAAASAVPWQRPESAPHRWQPQQQQPSKHACGGEGSVGREVTTTIIISRRGGHASAAYEEQEQLLNAAGASSGGSSCAAAQGMLEAVSSWRAAADHWRQRQHSYTQRQQPVAMQQQAAAVTPQTAATLIELRTQWQQQ